LPLGLDVFLPVPLDNPLTSTGIDLGRKIFFDKRLSQDGTVSCASCHDPARAFTDGRPRAVGLGGQPGRRNAPTLLNVAYSPSLFWDGRMTTLEEQAWSPLTNANEMGGRLTAIIEEISSDPSYRILFRKAFGTDEVFKGRIASALASYQRSLVAADAPFDRYRLRQDEFALSPASRRGWLLFRGKARCAQCHEEPLFTDHKFHNTGVGWGRLPHDFGRYEFTGKDDDRGKFKTPTLRHLTLTAPYMHDGGLATLSDVVAFYNRGGGANAYLDGVIRPLELTPAEQLDLVDFLEALSGPNQVRGVAP
jgi:cytochrome c peroxidase